MLPYYDVKSKKHGIQQILEHFMTFGSSITCFNLYNMHVVGFVSSRGFQPYMGLYILEILAKIYSYFKFENLSFVITRSSKGR